jgi:signal transduction histidine kinase
MVVVHDRNSAHDLHLQELDVLATIIADRTVASIVFNDAVLAEANLYSLSARSSISAACVFDQEGRLFANYRRDPALDSCRTAIGKDGMILMPSHALLIKSIMLDGDRVGELQIVSTFAELKNRLNRIVMFVVLIGAGVSLVVLLLSRLMVQKVSRPLLELSALVKKITRKNDYSLRADKVSRDEVGVLVDAVNNMLETIEIQSHVLMDANLRLEKTVTERTADLQEAQESLLRKEHLATLGQLTGTVSHELRNPLGTIQASVDVLRSQLQGCPIEVDRPLQRIIRNIHRCEAIINELLDYSRGGPPNLMPTKVSPWLREIVAGFSGHGKVQIDSDACEDVEVNIDPERMRRAVLNVLDNAMQACADRESCGSGGDDCRINVGLTYLNDRIRIAVKDTGVGMPESIIHKIFEPLFSTKAFGVGLGLAIVKQILEQHQGNVEVTSKAGSGTIVTLWFPVRRSVG